jgi:hypothetical protein
MSDLSAALRADGHDDLADKLEAKELAGRLRQSGRDDLADQLEGGQQQTTPAEPPRPLTPQERELQLATAYRDALNASLSPSHELGGIDHAA